MLYEMKIFHFYYQWKIPCKIIGLKYTYIFHDFWFQSAFQKDWPNYTFFNNVYKFHHHTLVWNNLFNTLLLIILLIKWNLDVLIASIRWLWWQTRRLEMVLWLCIIITFKSTPGQGVRLSVSQGYWRGLEDPSWLQFRYTLRESQLCLSRAPWLWTPRLIILKSQFPHWKNRNKNKTLDFF